MKEQRGKTREKRQVCIENVAGLYVGHFRLTTM